jgi:hypothetical protein
MQVFDRLAGRLNVGVMYMNYKDGIWSARFVLRDGTYYADHCGFQERRMKISITKNSNIKESHKNI